MRGLLVALEGIDGAGKTTQAKLLVRWLKKNGKRAFYTSEPTDGDIGKLIRSRMRGRTLDDGYIDTLLFAADRLSHYRHVVAPLLRRGYIVVSDRYLHSSIAYQGAFTGDVEWIKRVNSMVPVPDIAIYIDVPAEEGLRRLSHRPSRFERRTLLKKVRKLYLKLCREGELILVDGRRSVEDVHESLRSIVARRLGIKS